MMGTILILCIACIGLTHIMVDGKIMLWLRELIYSLKIKFLTDMIGCYQCMGFWMGVVLGSIYLPLDVIWYLQIPLWGFASSYLSMLGATILNFLDYYWVNVKQQ